MKAGLFTQSWYDNIAVASPLIATETQVDEGIAILHNVLSIADSEATHTDVAGSKSAEYFEKTLRGIK
jgi:hypothetical protein